MELQSSIDFTHVTKGFWEAVAKSQLEIGNPNKNSVNGHLKSKYADLPEVLNTIRPVYAANGLGIIQNPFYDGSLATVTTAMGHGPSGGYIVGISACVPAKSDAQGIGAATTYLRRYAAASMTAIAQEDDDGQAARHDRKPAEVVVKSIAVPSPKITLTQAAEINARIKSLKVNEEGFLRFYKIKAIHDMTQDLFENAQSRLDGTEAKQNKAAIDNGLTTPA